MNILFLTNEVDLNANAGGSQRSNVLVKAIKEALPPNSKLVVEQIPFSAYQSETSENIKAVSGAKDIEFSIRLTMLLEKTPALLLELFNKIDNSDFVIFDNCYCGPLLKYIKSNIKSQPKVMYLSHNYEKSLKAQISKILDWPEQASKRNLDFISEIENYLWRESDFTVVCSNLDANKLNETYNRDFFLIPNGGFKRNPPKFNLKEMYKFLNCNAFCLFVASGHPPNIDGFMEGIGRDFAFLPSGSKIIIIGSSVYEIESSIRNSKYHETYVNKCFAIPSAKNELLDNLYAHANCVIVPIFSGSGTSIKTIEALLSGKKIIATPFAFRGLDNIENDGFDIDFCTDSNTFKHSIVNNLKNPAVSSRNSEIVSEYEWSSIKSKATEIFKNIFNQLEVNKN